MPDNESESQPKKRKYNRKPPEPKPIPPNPAIAEMEIGLVPLVNQRLEINNRVIMATRNANKANQELQATQNELQQIEAEINYRMQLIQQLRNGGMPIPTSPYVASNLTRPQFSDYPTAIAPSAPYNPVTPFPLTPTFGVGSFPAPNRGLYPDATDRAESAEDVRVFEMQQRRGQ